MIFITLRSSILWCRLAIISLCGSQSWAVSGRRARGSGDAGGGCMGVLSILNNQLSRIGGAGLGVESKDRVRWKSAQPGPEIWRGNAITTLSPVRCEKTTRHTEITCSTSQSDTPVSRTPQKPLKIGKTAPWYLDNDLIINSEIL